MFIGRTSFTLVVREKRKTPDSLAPIRVATPSGCRKRRRPKSLFFPCSGNGNGSSWNNRGSNGNYWSSSLNSATNGRNLNFNSGGVFQHTDSVKIRRQLLMTKDIMRFCVFNQQMTKARNRRTE